MDFHVHLYFHRPDNDRLEQIMSALSDQITALSTSVDGAIARSNAVVADLDTKIAALQQVIDSGGASADDVAALAALQQKLDALDPTSPVVIPPTP